MRFIQVCAICKEPKPLVAKSGGLRSVPICADCRAKIDEKKPRPPAPARGKHRSYAGRPTTSRYLGVSRSRSGNWTAMIRHKKRLYTLGTYKTEEDAAHVRDRKAIELMGRSALLNFPLYEA